MDQPRVTLLVVNVGSSSIKLSALDNDDKLLDTDDIAHWDGDDGIIHEFAARVGGIERVGHRVVHGGPDFTGPVVIDDGVQAQLAELVPLAPLHQPRAIAAIQAARRALPSAVHVACFDTAFHTTMPPAAHVYALPQEWRDQWPLRRFGFHGLSHAYAARRAADLAGVELAELHLVTCHLGAGASLSAVRSGRSVDTTMGFTPLEGLVMATRAGSVDPGLVLWLMRSAGLTADAVQDGLEERSGLAGLAGTADMREIVERRARATRQPLSHSMCTGTDCAARSARCAPHSTASMRASSPVGWGSGRPQSAAHPGSSSTKRRIPPRAATRRSPRPGPRPGPSSSPRAKTSRSRVRYGCC